MGIIDDLDSYGDPNDLAEDVPAPREPRGEPDVTTDAFLVWMFDSETSNTVPDTYVVARDPSPLDFRMWIFAGQGEATRFVVRSSHKFGPDEQSADEEECCEVLLDSRSLSRDHCPAAVSNLITDLLEMPIIYPSTDSADDQSGPIQY